MMNYVMLVSRQGKFLAFQRLSLSCTPELIRFLMSCRKGQTRQMVPNAPTESKGKDRQGRHSAGTGSSDADV
jgi:hypothetical protein